MCVSAPCLHGARGELRWLRCPKCCLEQGLEQARCNVHRIPAKRLLFTGRPRILVGTHSKLVGEHEPPCKWCEPSSSQYAEHEQSEKTSLSIPRLKRAECPKSVTVYSKCWHHADQQPAPKVGRHNVEKGHKSVLVAQVALARLTTVTQRNSRVSEHDTVRHGIRPFCGVA